MFPEYRDLISELKNSDLHFKNLFEKHNQLDQQIQNLEANIGHATHEQIEQLKKQKLQLKDELYLLLQKHDKAK
jgi:uncharacterized protein YdcH (DUF465 family)